MDRDGFRTPLFILYTRESVVKANQKEYIVLGLVLDEEETDRAPDACGWDTGAHLLFSVWSLSLPTVDQSFC